MDIQELLDKVDIVDYISQYVDLEERNGEFWGLSPFQSEKTPSFSVRRETGDFFDFSSGIGGNCITFISHYHHVSKGQAVSILKKYANIDDSGVNFDAYKEKPACISVFSKYKHKKERPKACSSTVLPANYMDRFEDKPEKLQVWRDEGISDESMRFFGVKYDSFSNCIVYPIKNTDGIIVNVGGRTLDPDFKAKKIRKYTYFHAWGGRMGVIFGLYENKDEINRKHEVILFEGMKSVLLARGFGFKNTGAILTSHLNPAQMKILAAMGANVVFALDEEIDVRADRNIKTLSQYVNVSYLYDFKRLLQPKDAPVDRGEAVFRTLYEKCRYKL